MGVVCITISPWTANKKTNESLIPFAHLNSRIKINLMTVRLSTHGHRSDISNFYLPFMHGDEKNFHFFSCNDKIIMIFDHSKKNKNTLRDSIHSKFVAFVSCWFMGYFLLMHFLSFSLTGPERIEETNRWRRFLLSSSRPMSTCNFFIRLVHAGNRRN